MNQNGLHTASNCAAFSIDGDPRYAIDILAGIDLSRTTLGYTTLDADPGQTPKILLIDDRILERECLISRLTAAGFQVLDAMNAKERQASVEADTLSLILYVCDGSAEKRRRTIAGLLQAPHTHPVVVLSRSDAMANVIETIECGAPGYISTRANVDPVIAAIRFVRAGSAFVPASSMPTARKSRVDPAADPSWQSNLTAQQMAILEGIRRGKPNKVIAYERNACESTVKPHVRNVMKKRKARNRTEPAFRAIGMTP